MTYTETRNGENVYTYSDCEYMLNGLLTNVEMPGSSGTYVLYGDSYTTPEELGNFLYGYAGTAANFSEDVLIAGSIYASGIWKEGTTQESLIGEFTDHISIRKGIKHYYDDK